MLTTTVLVLPSSLTPYPVPSIYFSQMIGETRGRKSLITIVGTKKRENLFSELTGKFMDQKVDIEYIYSLFFYVVMQTDLVSSPTCTKF